MKTRDGLLPGFCCVATVTDSAATVDIVWKGNQLFRESLRIQAKTRILTDKEKERMMVGLTPVNDTSSRGRP